MANWLSPFWKQSFVTLGSALNMAQFGLSAAFVVAIVPQLQQPNSPIPIDHEMGSWLASVTGLTIIIGNIAVASIMSKYGRGTTNFLGLAVALGGWLIIVFADSFQCLLIGRILQGINLGLIVALAPIIVGECTSPKYRGLFLTSLSGIMSLGTLCVHAMSSYLHWRTCALVCVITTFINLLICLYSPESPSWLASQGRYEDSKKVFRWLRGNNEEDELQKLIEASKESNDSKSYVNQNNEIKFTKTILTKTKLIFKKKEVYKPIIISIHLLTLYYWSGLIILATYPNDVVAEIAGKDSNIPLVILSMDLLRVIAIFFAMYIIKIFRRKSVLLAGVGLNICVIFLISAYSYARNSNKLLVDKAYVGIILLHIQMFAVAIGALPLGVTIPGEIFPLEYRSMAMGFTTTVTSLNIFITTKTFSNLVNNFNFYGCYLIYGVISAYCLVVAYILLPETKDKTLQEIEEEFKGRPSKSQDISSETFLREC